MRQNKILFVVLCVLSSFLFSSCLLSLLVSGVSSANSKSLEGTITSSRFANGASSETSINGAPYIVQRFKFSSSLPNHYTELFKDANAKGEYLFPSSYNIYSKGLTVEHLIIICNALSIVDGLQPVYENKDGKVIQSIEDLKTLVITNPIANGWQLPVCKYSFSIDRTSNYSSYNARKASISEPYRGWFISGAVETTYYSSSSGSTSYPYVYFPAIKSKGKDVLAIATAKVEPQFFERGGYTKGFYVAGLNGTSALQIYQWGKTHGYNVNITRKSDYFYLLTKFSSGSADISSLGMTHEIVANILSEMAQFTPAYYFYDGTVYNNPTDRPNIYENSTNGYKPYSKFDYKEQNLIKSSLKSGNYLYYAAPLE